MLFPLTGNDSLTVSVWCLLLIHLSIHLPLSLYLSLFPTPSVRFRAAGALRVLIGLSLMLSKWWGSCESQTGSWPGIHWVSLPISLSLSPPHTHMHAHTHILPMSFSLFLYFTLSLSRLSWHPQSVTVKTLRNNCSNHDDLDTALSSGVWANQNWQ